MFRNLSILALYLICGSELCLACECIALRRPCEQMGSEAIFVGRVLETKPARHLLDKDSWTSGYSMRFSVEESIKGVPEKEITIETGSGGGDCGTPLPQGNKFLIFAYKNKDGKLWTGMCSGNRQLFGEPEEQNSLGQFRTLAKLNTVTIFGRIWSTTPVWRDNDVTETGNIPRSSVLVRAKGASLEKTTQTDEYGSYEFQGLPNQKYTVVPDRLPGLDYSHEYEDNYDASLSNGECKDIDFKLQPSTRVRGHIILPADLKQRTIEVEAIPSSLKKINQFSGQRDFTGDKGEFDLWPLPPGDYYVGVNINSSPKADTPFPPTYYPGVTSRLSAKIIHVGLGEEKEIELPISEIAQQRTVHFVAVGLDGKPLKTIYIQLEDLRHPGDAASYVNVDLDKNGNGTMSIFAGYSYHLHGSHWVSYQNDWCAKPVAIAGGTGPIDVRFEMDHKADNCDIYEIDHLKR
jgi:hypothetical protein